ncbi:MAG: hypothetical protein K1X74_16620 [Pirellulales bacterium]|nr:hypothetical protein [Pirellulales bacterium]
MYGDFSRPPLLTPHEYPGPGWYLAEQGRALTDADWNLQAATQFESWRQSNLRQFGHLAFFKREENSLDNPAIVRRACLNSNRTKLALCQYINQVNPQTATVATIPENSDGTDFSCLGVSVQGVLMRNETKDPLKHMNAALAATNDADHALAPGVILASAVPLGIPGGALPHFLAEGAFERCEDQALATFVRSMVPCGYGYTRLTFFPRWSVVPKNLFFDYTTYLQRRPTLRLNNQVAACTAVLHVAAHSYDRKASEVEKNRRIVCLSSARRPTWLVGVWQEDGNRRRIRLMGDQLERFSHLKKNALIEVFSAAQQMQVLDRSIAASNLYQVETLDSATNSLTLKDATEPEGCQIPFSHSLPLDEGQLVVLRTWEHCEMLCELSHNSSKADGSHLSLVRTKCGDKHEPTESAAPTDKAKEQALNTVVPGDEWTVYVRDGVQYSLFHQADRYCVMVARKADNGTPLEFLGQIAQAPQVAPAPGAPPPATGGMSPANHDATNLAQGDNSHDRLRDLPLRHLNVELQSPHVRRWIASANVSEVAHLTRNALRESIVQAVKVDAASLPQFDQDVSVLHKAVAAVAGRLSRSPSSTVA